MKIKQKLDTWQKHNLEGTQRNPKKIQKAPWNDTRTSFNIKFRKIAMDELIVQNIEIGLP